MFVTLADRELVCIAVVLSAVRVALESNEQPICALLGSTAKDVGMKWEVVKESVAMCSCICATAKQVSVEREVLEESVAMRSCSCTAKQVSVEREQSTD